MPGPDEVDYSAVAGAIAVAISVVAVVFTIWLRDWRRRLRQFQRAAATARRNYRPDASDPIKGVAGETIRMTLLVDVNESGEVEKAEAWLSRPSRSPHLRVRRRRLRLLHHRLGFDGTARGDRDAAELVALRQPVDAA